MKRITVLLMVVAVLFVVPMQVFGVEAEAFGGDTTELSLDNEKVADLAIDSITDTIYLGSGLGFGVSLLASVILSRVVGDSLYKQGNAIDGGKAYDFAAGTAYISLGFVAIGFIAAIAGAGR